MVRLAPERPDQATPACSPAQACCCAYFMWGPRRSGAPFPMPTRAHKGPRLDLCMHHFPRLPLAPLQTHAHAGKPTAAAWGYGRWVAMQHV